MMPDRGSNHFKSSTARLIPEARSGRDGIGYHRALGQAGLLIFDIPSLRVDE
jgi:hypothetical protein